MREAERECLEVFGEDFDVNGETRRGVFSNNRRVSKITFPPIWFPLKEADTIKRLVNQRDYVVVYADWNVVAGVPVSFVATVRTR